MTPNMSKTLIVLLVALASAGKVYSQAAEYYQCGGGPGYTGATSCQAGLTCYCQNPYYSQCLSNDPGWGNSCDSGGSSGSSNGNTGGNGNNGGGNGANGTSGIEGSGTPIVSPIAKPLSFEEKAGNIPAVDSGSENTASPVAAQAGSSPPASPQAGSGNGDSSSGNGNSGSAAVNPNPGACGAFTGSKDGYASTTHFYDGTVGSCGCGSNGVMSQWQLGMGPNLYTAASNQGMFGEGTFCGSGCGICYELTNVGYTAHAQSGTCDGAGQTITVMITDLCPANGNPWCTQPNPDGFNAHFDIMSQGLPNGWNNPVVSYKKVDCPGVMSTNFNGCRCTLGGGDKGGSRLFRY